MSPHPEQQYLDLLWELMASGDLRQGRNSEVYSLFGKRLEFDLAEGFPLLTTKRVNFRSVVMELLWFLRGETNIETLGCGIWDEWADENGDVGPVYGAQWRNWGDTDQIQQLIEGLRGDPYGRRHIVSSWNVAELDQMGLPPCHAFFQMYVEADGRLSCMLHQRSADVFLGVPFNIASYALLTTILGKILGLKPGRLIMNFGDVHLYVSHYTQASEQVRRTPTPLPQVLLAGNRAAPWDYQLGDFTLVNYLPQEALPAEVIA